MKIKFWGTRGSLPRATTHEDLMSRMSALVDLAKGRGLTDLNGFAASLRDGSLAHPLTYGGNTSCTEIAHKGQSFFVDMGSGFRDACTKAMSESRKEFNVFVTHMHWDHLIGLPYFVPIYSPGHKINIYHVHRNAPEHIRMLFNGVNHPVKWDQLGAKVEFQLLKLYQPVVIKEVNITPFCLDHPGGSFGYRFDADGQSVVVGVDGEYKRLTREELGPDLPYYQNLDLLSFDSQYEMAELANRFDWGHCTPNIGVDLALREGIRNIVFTHHDPWADEIKVHRMYSGAILHMRKQLPSFKEVWDQQPDGPRLFSGYDGLEIDLDKYKQKS